MNRLIDKSDFVVWHLYGNRSPHPTEIKLKHFENLPSGWNRGQGIKFSSKVLREAIGLHQTLINAGYSDTDAFPGVNGEVQISVYNLPNSCEITIKPNGQWLIVFENNEGECMECSGGSFHRVIPFIVGIIDNTWNISTSLRINSGSQNWEDLPAWHSSHLMPMEEYPSLNWNASWPQQERFVPTSDVIIQMLQGSLQYFGNSPVVFYQTPLSSTRRQVNLEIPATET